MSASRLSLISIIGICGEGTCGYCKNNTGSRERFGCSGYKICCRHFNDLLDRGWTRSGRYIYKPLIGRTCCAQYTIRLDVNKFMLSKSQKKLLRKINDFLVTGKQPKVHTSIASSSSNRHATKSSESTAKPMISQSFKSTDVKGQDEQKCERGVKKKFLRRERAFQRMREKGINIEEAKRKRIEKEFSRRRTLESLISMTNQVEAKHKLEVRLVHLRSNEFISSEAESFEVFKKYQKFIHNDERCSKKSYVDFLVDSPLVSDEDSDATQNITLGSYHRQYLLDGKIVAVGVIDILPNCVSSKYLYYDPDYDFLNLGTYSALSEIAFTMELTKTRPGLHYYYMGYYIDTCPKMRYKSAFRPSDLLCDITFTWVPLSKCIELIRLSSSERIYFNPEAPVAESAQAESVQFYYKGVAFTYSGLLKRKDFEGFKFSLEHYLQVAGPVAKDMVIYL